MRVPRRVVSLLLAASLAVSSQMIRLPGFEAAIADPVPGPVLHAVRECLAAIDRFLIDGDLEALWQTLDQRGHGLDPWPHTDASHRNLAALAIRATFPARYLSLAHIAPSEEFYAVTIKTEQGTRFLPGWLDAGVVPALSDRDLLVALDERGSILAAGGARTSGPIAYSAPGANAPFMLTEPSRLAAAWITLTPSQRRARYLSVSAPGLVAPAIGSLLVSGEGQLLVLAEGGARWRQLATGESMLMNPGDLLYLAGGYAILTMTSDNPARFLFAGVTSPPQNTGTDEDGRPKPTSLAELVSSAQSSPATTWFGSIEPAPSSGSAVAPGMTSLGATWVVLPPGEGVRVTLGFPYLVIDIGTEDAAAVFDFGNLFVENPTDRTEIVLIVRALPA